MKELGLLGFLQALLIGNPSFHFFLRVSEVHLYTFLSRREISLGEGRGLSGTGLAPHWSLLFVCEMQISLNSEI